MTLTVIALIVIGLIFIFASYFISEAMSASLEEEKTDVVVDVTLTDEQKMQIQQQIEYTVSQYCENIIYNTQERLSAMSNEKTLALGDYAVAVCEEIEKNHKEEMFLYSMLGDKEKELKTLVQQVDELKMELKDSMETKTIARVEQPVMPATPEPEELDPFEATMQEIDTMEIDFEKEEEVSKASEGENANELILELKRSGMSIVEIAKQLGLGVGEVKLVVDLYKGE